MSPSDIDPELLAIAIAAVQSAQAKKQGRQATVRELWNEWEPHVTATDVNWRIALAHKRGLLDTLVHMAGRPSALLGDLQWSEINPFVCELWRTARKAANTSRTGKPPKDNYLNRQLTTLQRCFKWHLGSGKIERDPIAKWHRVDERQFKRRTPLSPDDFALYIERAHPTYQDICTVQYRCYGLRPGEARLLLKTEIHWESKVIILDPSRTKNQQTDPIPIPEDCLPILRRWCDYSRGPHVFVRPQDPRRLAPLPYGTYNNWARDAREKSKLQGINGERIVSYHWRHAGITEPLLRGARPSFVGKAARVTAKVMDENYVGYGPREQESLREVQESWSTRRSPLRALQEDTDTREAK